MWVMAGSFVSDCVDLTPSQWEALVILLAAISDNIPIGKKNDLRAKQVNSQAFRVLRERGLGCYEYDTVAGEVISYASCTDKALLDAMEHTPRLRAAVKKAEAVLRG